MVKMTVYGLALDETAQVPVLILKDVKEDTTLPIWVGATEAMAISLALNKVALPRPMTHDLMLNLVHQLGAEVLRVELVREERGTYFAEIVLQVAEEEMRVDSRPSDAISLSLRAKCDLWVSKQVLETALEQLGDAESRLTPNTDRESWEAILQQYSGDDNKYKM